MCLQGVEFFYWRSRGEGLRIIYIFFIGIGQLKIYREE